MSQQANKRAERTRKTHEAEKAAAKAKAKPAAQLKEK